jgi:ATP-dependent phosphofructokinase / diphosphate-dependent phosphofructokinase
MVAARVGVLTNGGDCPGLNAGIAAARNVILDAGATPVLLRDGYASLVQAGTADSNDPHADHAATIDAVTIDAATIDWRRCVRWGGSVLGSSRTNLGRDKLYRKALTGIERLNLTGLVIFGGDGTLTSAARLAADGVTVGAAPKTIDNDVAGSELSIGFSTAVNSAVEALDRLADTAITHNRGFLIEVMGRRSGQLAVAVAVAGGADGVCVPEAPWGLDQLRERLTTTPGGPLIVVAESAWADQTTGRRATSKPTPVGGAARAAADALATQDLTVGHVALGHTLRGGTPTPTDRTLGRQLGALAAVAALTGSHMAAVRDGVAQLVDVADAGAGRRHLNTDDLNQLGPLLIRHP